MAEIINNRQVFSLFEVAASIRKTLAERYKSAFWVKAEMNKLNLYSHSGHCYPELVEKRDGKVIAQIKSNLWKVDYERINADFLKVLKEPLRDGITILFCATVTFDPSYGLSLRILDIDPSYSLGELERERQETLERLRAERIYDSNKHLSLPLLPQRIAVISVETSKGYSDFLKVINHNAWNYKFFLHLFPSLLQGERSVQSICNQLRRIRKVIHHFDVVAIIRGGGGDVGLSSYNNYQLAREIALFPIPVLTGIGHSTNETVAEMVSHKNAITPTELADFLLQKFHDFSNPLTRFQEVIIERSRRMLQDEHVRFKGTVRFFRSVTNSQLQRTHDRLSRYTDAVLNHSGFVVRRHADRLNNKCKDLQQAVFRALPAFRFELQRIEHQVREEAFHSLKSGRERLSQLEKSVSILDPVNVLRRGYSITLANGKAVTNSADLANGAQITTLLANGSVESEVTKILKSTDDE